MWVRVNAFALETPFLLVGLIPAPVASAGYSQSTRLHRFEANLKRLQVGASFRLYIQTSQIEADRDVEGQEGQRNSGEKHLG